MLRRPRGDRHLRRRSGTATAPAHARRAARRRSPPPPPHASTPGSSTCPHPVPPSRCGRSRPPAPARAAASNASPHGLPLRYGSSPSTSSRIGMNRIVNASPTNPSTTSLNGRTPSSCGRRNPAYTAASRSSTYSSATSPACPRAAFARSSHTVPPCRAAAGAGQKSVGVRRAPRPSVSQRRRPRCGAPLPAGRHRPTRRIAPADLRSAAEPVAQLSHLGCPLRRRISASSPREAR